MGAIIKIADYCIRECISDGKLVDVSSSEGKVLSHSLSPSPSPQGRSPLGASAARCAPAAVRRRDAADEDGAGGAGGGRGGRRRGRVPAEGTTRTRLELPVTLAAASYRFLHRPENDEVGFDGGVSTAAAAAAVAAAAEAGWVGAGIESASPNTSI